MAQEGQLLHQSQPMQEEPAQGEAQIAGEEEPGIGLIEKIFHDHDMKCSRHEAESLSNLVASLGVDHKGESILNDGPWLSMEEKGWKLRTDKEFETMFQTLEKTKPLLFTGLPSSGAFVELQRQQNELQFHFEMCFAPQRRAFSQHLNFQKWSDNGVFCTF